MEEGTKDACWKSSLFGWLEGTIADETIEFNNMIEENYEVINGNIKNIIRSRDGNIIFQRQILIYSCTREGRGSSVNEAILRSSSIRRCVSIPF